MWDDKLNYAKRPVTWVKDKLREHMWSAQRTVMRSVLDNRYTAVHSAHDLGKSKVAANIAAWWMDSHPPGEAFVVSTAPTAAQVSAILWREIGKNHRVGKLKGRVLSAGYPQWKIGSELVGYGRKPADYEESAFQGIHARYVLVIIDEAGGVARSLYDSVDALVTNENCRVLAIGNPDNPGSHFASITKPGSDWNVIHLDGLRSPNITKELVIGDDIANPKFPLLAALMRAERVPYSTEVIPHGLRDLLISPLWIEERIRRWAGLSATAHLDYTRAELDALVRSRCEASSLFQAKVRGVFPSGSSEGVIPLGWVQMAVNRWHDWHDNTEIARYENQRPVAIPGRTVVGIDVAGGGEDETAFAIRNGNVVRKIDRFRLADTTETVTAATQHLMEPGSMGVVDVIGIGAGVYDMLRKMKNEGTIAAQVIPFNASAATPRKDLIGQFKFRNDRAAAWWHFRELLDPSRGSQICLPDDERLIEELVAVRYEHFVGGVIKIESKDDIRKRLGRSTDSADSVIQSFWIEGLDGKSVGEAIPYATATSTATYGQAEGQPARFTPDDFEAEPGFGGYSPSLPARVEHAGYSLDDWTDDLATTSTGWDL